MIPFEKIYNCKWLNSTYKLNEIALEMQELQVTLNNGLQIIEELDTDFKQEIKDKLFETLDISQALQENARLKELREKQKAIEIQKDKQVKEFLAEKAEQKLIEQQKAEQKQQPQEQKQEANSLQILDFRVWVTPEQKRLLKDFLIKNNIKYGRVK